MIAQSTRPYSIVYLNKGNKFLKFSETISAFAYYKNYRVNLITGAKKTWSLTKIQVRLEEIKLRDTFENPSIRQLV